MAYIVTPDKSSDVHTGAPLYHAKVPKMAHTVATILGIPDGTVKIVTHVPIDKKRDKSNSLKAAERSFMR